MRPAVLFGFIAALTGQGHAQKPPDLAEILKKVSETYRAVSEFELISVSTGTAVPGRVLWAFRAPSQFRLEGADPNLDGADGSFDQTVLVRDGASVWWYHPRANEYAVLTGQSLPDELKPEVMAETAIGRFRSAADLPGTFLREEALEINGTKTDCYVVSAPVTIPGEGTSLHIWWIEKKSNDIVREDGDEGSSVVFTTIKLNEPLPNDLFKFAPPPGARKVDGK